MTTAALVVPFLLSCRTDRPGSAEPAAHDTAASQSGGVTPRAQRTPLAWFEGTLLGGGTAGTELFRGRRGIVYLFASTDPDANLVAEIVQRIEVAARKANVVILGVNRDLEPERGVRFIQSHAFGFPVVLDPDNAISGRLGVPYDKPSVVAVDSDGFLLGGFAGLEGEFPERDRVYERELRGLLRLESEEDLPVRFGVLPEAADVRVVSLEGRGRMLSSFQGKVVVLVLFSPLCPHCALALQSLQALTDELAQPNLEIVPVSVLNRRYLIEEMFEELNVRFVSYVDPDYSLQKAYAHRYAVPDTLVMTKEGRIFARHQGFSDRIRELLTMEIRQTLGLEPVILLDEAGYSGNDNCQICHRKEHETWALTRHAYAFETLVEHGSDRDPECLSCHTVGWGRKGGYSSENPADYLEDVGCESCHGRGGPHQSKEFVENGYESICKGCHTGTHSLNFVFDERLPFVSHQGNELVTRLSIAERRELLSKRDLRERPLFHRDRFAGSEGCERCHPIEYQIWSGSAHARALDSLLEKRSEAIPECQRCHTTGFGQAGGFPEGGDALAHVGCESCHGPGEIHARESGAEPGTPSRGEILALRDKCNTCVVLQICGSCHDPANDPGFEFEVLDKIEQLRHGNVSTGSRTP